MTESTRHKEITSIRYLMQTCLDSCPPIRLLCSIEVFSILLIFPSSLMLYGVKHLMHLRLDRLSCSMTIRLLMGTLL